MQPENIFADDGSGTLLQDLVRLVVNDGDEVVFGSPSFAAYDIDVLLAGGVSVKVPLDESWTYDLEGVEHAITDKTRMVLLCNPNNPTGTFLTTAQIRVFLQKIENTGILVVIDEAYRDFVNCEDCEASSSLVSEFDNVVLLRTFSRRSAWLDCVLATVLRARKSWMPSTKSWPNSRYPHSPKRLESPCCKTRRSWLI